MTIGSLSTDVREPRIETGSKMFSFLVHFCSSQQTGQVLVGCLWFDVTDVMESKSSKKEKIQLLVAVLGSRTTAILCTMQKFVALSSALEINIASDRKCS